jgi:hypothetical protein
MYMCTFFGSVFTGVPRHFLVASQYANPPRVRKMATAARPSGGDHGVSGRGTSEIAVDGRDDLAVSVHSQCEPLASD